HTDAALSVGEGVRDAVLAAAQERPVLLALDDAHWIDAATLESLPGLARDAARRPVLLLFGLARGAPESGRLDELRARVGRELEGEVIRLGRLDPAALHALVAWALPAYAAPDAQRLARRVEQDTAGIPLLALALLEWERWLVADARGYVFAAPIVCGILLQEMVTPGQARRYRDSLAS